MNSPFISKKLRFSELFALSTVLLRVYWKFAFVIAMLFTLPETIIKLFMPSRLTNAAKVLYQEIAVMLNNEEAGLDALMQLMQSPSAADALQYTYITLGLTLLFAPPAAGAFSYLAAQGLKREPASFLGVLEASVMKLWKYAATYLLLGASVFLSAWLFFIPALFIGVATAFSSNIIALTDNWGIGALRESYRVVKGQFFHTLGFLIGVGLMAYIFEGILNSVFLAIGAYSTVVTLLLANMLRSTFLGIFSFMIALRYMNELACKQPPAAPAEPPSSDAPDEDNMTD